MWQTLFITIFSSPKRIFYTFYLQPCGHGCPSGSWLLKDLEICEHNTFCICKFVNKWAKNHKTYSWWYKLGISLPRYQKLWTIPTPRNFIVHKRTLKQRIIIILTTWMSKPNPNILDVTGLQLHQTWPLNFFFHTLQLSGMSQWMTNGGSSNNMSPLNFVGRQFTNSIVVAP